MSKHEEWRGDSGQPPFDPVPVRPRHDGWTPARQVAFIKALGQCGCVLEACRAVGKSSESAYELRAREFSHSFREAWDAALDLGVARVADAAVGRAIHGVVTPVFYKGEQVGEKRSYDERLTMFILRTRAPHRFGRAAEDAAREAALQGDHQDVNEVYSDALAALETDAEIEERDRLIFEEEEAAEAAEAAQAAPASYEPAAASPADVSPSSPTSGSADPAITPATVTPRHDPVPERAPCHPALPFGSGTWSRPILPPEHGRPAQPHSAGPNPAHPVTAHPEPVEGCIRRAERVTHPSTSSG